MIRKLIMIVTFLLFWSSPVLADDADDVRATIERHYAAIHTGDMESIFSSHLEDFTMFFSDGDVLFESDWSEVSERMGATVDLGTPNVRMSNFNAQIYGNVVVATFYLVGTNTYGGKTRNVTNRVCPVLVKIVLDRNIRRYATAFIEFDLNHINVLGKSADWQRE